MNVSSSLQHKIFKQIGSVADVLQLEMYVVGGYVRDLILNRPSKDIDFVCVGSDPFGPVHVVAFNDCQPGCVPIADRYSVHLYGLCHLAWARSSFIYYREHPACA